MTSTAYSAALEVHNQLHRQVLDELIVTDLTALRQRWKGAVDRVGVGIPTPARLTQDAAIGVGIGIQRRLDLLLNMDPRPAAIPSRPPWQPLSLVGATKTDHTDKIPWLFQRSTYERTLTNREHMAAVRYLDQLTAMAADMLLPAYAGLRSHWTQDLISEDPGLICTPDLVLEGVVVEIKAVAKPSLDRDWIEQLARYILMDVDNRWHLQRADLYQARRGILFSIDLGEIVSGAGTARGLARARNRYRSVVASKQALRALEASGLVR